MESLEDSNLSWHVCWTCRQCFMTETRLEEHNIKHHGRRRDFKDIACSNDVQERRQLHSPKPLSLQKKPVCEERSKVDLEQKALLLNYLGLKPVRQNQTEGRSSQNRWKGLMPTLTRITKGPEKAVPYPNTSSDNRYETARTKNSNDAFDDDVTWLPLSRQISRSQQVGVSTVSPVTRPTVGPVNHRYGTRRQSRTVGKTLPDVEEETGVGSTSSYVGRFNPPGIQPSVSSLSKRNLAGGSRSYGENLRFSEILKRHMMIRRFGTVPIEEKLQNGAHPISHVETRLVESGRKLYICQTCGVTFNSKAFLVVHQRIHSGEDHFKRKRNMLEPASIALKTSDQESRAQPYGCGFCDKRFRTQGGLQHHIQSHRGDKPFSCDVCGHKFTKKFSLTVHRRSHTGERPFACNDCGEAFKLRKDLVQHCRSHTGETPYECDVCPAAYTCKKDLVKHNGFHTGVRPFLCSVCGLAFALKRGLSLHMDGHGQDDCYECSVCKQRFQTIFKIKSHSCPLQSL